MPLPGTTNRGHCRRPGVLQPAARRSYLRRGVFCLGQRLFPTCRAHSKASTLTEDAQALQALAGDGHALADLSSVYIDSLDSHFINQLIQRLTINVLIGIFTPDNPLQI
jgi:hypothetical protein